MGGADAIPHCVPLQGYSLPQCKGFLPVGRRVLLLSDLPGWHGVCQPFHLPPVRCLRLQRGRQYGLDSRLAPAHSPSTSTGATAHPSTDYYCPCCAPAANVCACAQTPFSKHFPIFMLFGGLTWACSWLNNRNFQPVESMSAEYKAAEAKNIIVSCFWCCWQQQLTGG